MIHRERLHRPGYVYPVEEWRLPEKHFYPAYLGQTETFFSVSNGYLGMRGAFEEGRPVHHNGTFVNGFYESWPITYAEAAFGFAKTGQTIVTVPDTKIITLYVDDEPFFLPTADIQSFERALDMRAGTLDREVLWETPAGKRVAIRSRRLVSYEHRHLAAISYEVTVLNMRRSSSPPSCSTGRTRRNRAETPGRPGPSPPGCWRRRSTSAKTCASSSGT
jgi:alpha,alpha-trehalose phosphorylase